MAYSVYNIQWDPADIRSKGLSTKYLVVGLNMSRQDILDSLSKSLYNIPIVDADISPTIVTALSEVQWSDLKVGDRLISAIGNAGRIVELEDIKKYNGDDQITCM